MSDADVIYKTDALIAEDIDKYLETHQHKTMLRFITCGSVDDGKSTLIGRLLYDSKMIFEDQLEALHADSKKVGTQGQEIDFALLVDGLAAEREQGITIDVAYRSFDANGRRILLGDAPGHVQYTRNMVTASAGADVAILLIDAKNGILPQTRRHLALCAMLGVREVIACVNKIDLVDYSEARFDEIEAELRAAADAVGVRSLIAIPLSALNGVNVVTRSDATPWYDGPCVLEVLHDVDPPIAEAAFRMPVQWVVRHDDGVDDVRGLAGRVESGTVAVGDEIVALPSGATTRIARIDVLGRVVESASAPFSVTLHFEDDVDVSRGDMIARVKNAPKPSQDIDAMVCWMTTAPLQPRQKLAIKHTTRTGRALVKDIQYRLDVNTLHRDQATNELGVNEIGRVTLRTTVPLLCDPYSKNRTTGSFILIDEATGVTVGAGMING